MKSSDMEQTMEFYANSSRLIPRKEADVADAKQAGISKSTLKKAKAQLTVQKREMQNAKAMCLLIGQEMPE